MSTISNRSRVRRINEVHSRSGRGGGRGRLGGRGRGGRFNRNGGRYNNRHYSQGNDRRRGRPDARMIRCTDGTEIEVHPAYKSSATEWNLLPEAERNRIISERSNYKRQRVDGHNNGTSSVISELTTNNQGDVRSIVESVQNLQHQISSLVSHPSDNDNNNNTPPSSIMGGRNEQSNLRSRNRNK